MLSSDATTSRSREHRTSWIIYKGRRLGSRTRVTDDHHTSLSNWFDWSTELERMRGQTEFTETEIKSSTWTPIHHLDLHFWLQVRGPRSRNWKCHLGEDGCLNVLVHRPNNLQKRNVREFCFDINLSSNTIPASKSNPISHLFSPLPSHDNSIFGVCKRCQKELKWKRGFDLLRNLPQICRRNKCLLKHTRLQMSVANYNKKNAAAYKCDESPLKIRQRWH